MNPVTMNLPDIPANILIISDDPEVRRDWAAALEGAGHRVSLVALEGVDVHTVVALDPDLCVVDSRSGDEAVLDCCRKLREATVIPLALFTARADEAYLLAAFAAGLDMVVPYRVSPRLFLTMVNAWLRRARALPAAFAAGLHVGGFTLYLTRRRLETPEGETIKLTGLEARLLYVLMRRPGRPVDAPRLVRWVWGYEAHGDHGALKNLVYRLRRKLEADPGEPRVLVRVEGAGYCFMADVTPPQ